jgi:hypothetical protein
MGYEPFEKAQPLLEDLAIVASALRMDLMDDTFPDLEALSDEELKGLIHDLTEQEQEVSYRRRILHGRIDILRAELVNRLRGRHEEGEPVISRADVQQLTHILARRGIPADADIE